MHFEPNRSAKEEGDIVFRLGDSPVEVVVVYDDHSIEDILETVEGMVPLDLVSEAIVALDGEMSVQDTNFLVAKLREMGLNVSPTLQGIPTSLEDHGERHLSVAFL